MREGSFDSISFTEISAILTTCCCSFQALQRESAKVESLRTQNWVARLCPMARLKDVGEGKIDLSDAKHSVHMISLGIFLSVQSRISED